MSFDWEAWVKSHPNPEAARIVLSWLERHDPDEPVRRMREELVDLVIEAEGRA